MREPTDLPSDPQEHPLRRVVNDEVHARPFLKIGTPARVWLVAHLTSDVPGAAARYAAELSAIEHRPPPGPTERHMVLMVDGVVVKWERHTEFTTLTVIGPPTALPPPQVRGLLDRLPGERLVAIDLHLEADTEPKHSAETLAAYFGGNEVVGSAVNGGDALVWTDFRIATHGWTIFLVRNIGLSDPRAGRLVQRLLEVEVYRMMALMGLPLAREIGGPLSALEKRLAEIVSRTPIQGSPDDEQKLLDALTQLAAEAEALSARSRYRFGATAAYAELVRKRLVELREDRIEGLSRLGVFLDRRFLPAMDTCIATDRRQRELVEGINRASAMLQTRVEVEMAQQNADLLRSMDKRTKAQLRIQEAVEGLSVFAVSYYAIGLVKYLSDGALSLAGLPVPKEAVPAAILPIVLAFVWLGVRRLRHKIDKDD